MIGMERVRASDVLLVLNREADKREREGDGEGAKRLRIRPATLRKWVQRGHVTRRDHGYDLAEILAYLERRESRDTTHATP
jgi:hypothetical protein